jgi:hypothetical protein
MPADEWTVIGRDAWTALQDVAAAAGDPVAFAVDITPERSRGSIVAAGNAATLADLALDLVEHFPAPAGSPTGSPRSWRSGARAPLWWTRAARPGGRSPRWRPAKKDHRAHSHGSRQDPTGRSRSEGESGAAPSLLHDRARY